MPQVFRKTPIFGVEFTVGNSATPAELAPEKRVDDDVEIVEDEMDACLLYYADGEKEMDREPAYNQELGLAVEKLRDGKTIRDLWSVT